MPAAARVTDSTAHPGTILGPGVATVLIAGLPACVAGDSHKCNFTPPPQSHGTNNILGGSGTVMIGKRPAARIGDATMCGAVIVTGAATVIIGG
ncbi:MAG: PAAR domain-containing protein [Gammaproteobacteria bacterium]